MLEISIDQVPKHADGLLARLSKLDHQARESLFGRVEARDLEREEAQGCSHRFEPFLHGLRLVLHMVVHDGN